MTSRTSISGRLRLSAISFLAVSTLALSACSNGDGPKSGEPSAGPTPSASQSASVTPSASPTPKPTPVYKPADAKGRAQNVPVPVKPPLADKNSKEGLEAFAKYWYKLINYAYETGNLKPVNAITSPTCASCNRVRPTIETWNHDGKWIEGGALQIFNATTKFAPDANGNQQVFVQYHRMAVNYRQPDGKIEESFPKSNLLADIFIAEHQGARWFVTNVDRIGG
jgi:hypothetical protein